MDYSIKLIIHKGSTIFDSVIITSYSTTRYEQKIKDNRNKDEINSNIKINTISLNKRGYNAYLVSAYVMALINSQTYHRAAFKKLQTWLIHRIPGEINSRIILMKLCTPKKQFLDYKWNDRITQMVLERREVDHAMSWLSTLGGAFSALGEEFQHCAEIAGKISVKQLELAMRLGDPHLVARCKLYAALSLIQQGQLRIPKIIVRNIYKFSINQNDVRLQNMCHGIWAKLKYCYKTKKEWYRLY
ncbi:uncharacterized protein LOC116427558 [Nomia melanderi]|uniref:uncharacterized protein LOC116427558 n=1 Tax=Nomia melanderi TaxID=2448451 RepID=UPI001304604C|nr:uncharacterized protein LOC116427558 [Nomia melanderi]